MDNKVTGNKGEDLAAEFLITKGYTILHRNWRFKYWEVDIIAVQRKIPAFFRNQNPHFARVWKTRRKHQHSKNEQPEKCRRRISVPAPAMAVPAVRCIAITLILQPRAGIFPHRRCVFLNRICFQSIIIPQSFSETHIVSSQFKRDIKQSVIDWIFV